MPDRKRKPERTTPHKDKIFKTCGRTFEWRKQWAQDWDIIKYCSDACRGHKPGATDAALEATILSLLGERGPNKTRRLVATGKIIITQHGHIVDPSTAKGPIRLRLR